MHVQDWGLFQRVSEELLRSRVKSEVEWSGRCEQDSACHKLTPILKLGRYVSNNGSDHFGQDPSHEL